MYNRKGSLHSSPVTNTFTDTIRVKYQVNGGVCYPLLNKGLMGTYEDKYTYGNGGVGDG